MRVKAVAALLEAGHGARRRAATDDAVQFADRALALARAGAGVPGRARAQGARAARRGAGPTRAWPPTRRRSTSRAARTPSACARTPRCCARATRARSRGREWREWAVAQIEQGLAGDAERRDTFEVGALLIGRASMVRWFVLDGEELAKARRAAERAIEIAERIGSTQLLSHGLEALGWRDADHGFCDAERDRRPDARGRAPDARPRRGVRVAGHRRDLPARAAAASRTPFAAGREAAASARHLSPHRRMHAASAQTVCLLGAGRFDELAEATSEAPALVDARGQPDVRDGLARARRPRGRAVRGARHGRRRARRRATSRRSACTAATRRSATAGSRSCGRSSGSSARARGSSYGEPVRGLVDGVHDLRVRVQLVALRGRRRRAAGRQGPPGRARGVRAPARAGSPTGPRRCAPGRSSRRGRGDRRARRLRRALHGGAPAGRRAAAGCPIPPPPRRPPRGCARWARSPAPRSSAEAAPAELEHLVGVRRGHEVGPGRDQLAARAGTACGASARPAARRAGSPAGTAAGRRRTASA